ncbi:MAG: NnrU family protein, partial [Phenylobacterium sp.]|nr:NnrU family protein [Phenylobacterium sp.]
MIQLTAAAAFFVLIHLLISGTRVRDVLVSRIGEGAYMGLFSLASVAGLAWMIMAYGQVRGDAANEVYWGVGEATRHIQLLLQFIAIFFVVIGLTT